MAAIFFSFIGANKKIISYQLGPAAEQTEYSPVPEMQNSAKIPLDNLDFVPNPYSLSLF
jgi:hypothetical protein